MLVSPPHFHAAANKLCKSLVLLSNSDKIGRAFYLEGYGIEWGGSGYRRYGIRRLIPKFAGTKNIDELVCLVLNDDMRTTLQERGRLYASLSGIHYKTYRDKRVMIDKKAFNDKDGYILDP